MCHINPNGIHYRPGVDIPGYSGYIPGKYADNVFGQTHARANHISQAIKINQYESSMASKNQIAVS